MICFRKQNQKSRQRQINVLQCQVVLGQEVITLFVPFSKWSYMHWRLKSRKAGFNLVLKMYLEEIFLQGRFFAASEDRIVFDPFGLKLFL